MWASYEIRDKLKIDRLFSFFEMECHKGYNFKGESHNFWECMYVERGAVCVSADERVYRLKENEIIFHKPMEIHKFYTDCDQGARIYVFSFSLEGELYAYFADKVFVLDDEQKSVIYSLIEYAKKHTAAKEDIERRRDFLIDLNPSGYVLEMYLTYIYQIFLSLAISGSLSFCLDSTEATVFRRAVDYMNSNIDKNISVGQIAKYCAVSETGIKRLFGKFAGLGVHKYYLKLKIKAAESLLAAGVMVSETADRLGFGSQGYFSAAFKRETGKNPSEVHKKL